jgi:hypothetical protein
MSGLYASDIYGVDPWGTTGPAPGRSILAEPVRENTIRIAFFAPVLINYLEDIRDSLTPNKYVVNAISGVGLDGNAVHEVRVVKVMTVDGEPAQLDIVLDRNLSHWPCRYEVQAFGVYMATGALFPSPMVVEFDSVREEFVKPSVDFYRSTKDVSNPTSLSALLDPVPDVNDFNLGSFTYGDDGDYAMDEGVENLRKRLYRRVIVKPGGFVWLPEYGVGITNYGKRVNSAGIREKLRSEMESQINQEPDVKASKVLLAQSTTPGLFKVYMKVLTKDNKAYQFAYEYPLVDSVF